MPGAGSNRINEFGFYTNYYTLPKLGKDINGYFDILWMPETFIIERMKYKENLTREWRGAFYALTGESKMEARRIIAQNDFSESVVAGAVYEEVREVLRYYMLPKLN